MRAASDHSAAALWALALGAGLCTIGVLAWCVAATTTLLPYDEEFVGLTRAQIAAADPRILAFMTHDRITLAGVLIAVGLMYVVLARRALRYGERWAWDAVALSAAIGFASFLLFLGFRYFDVLHFIVTLLILPFFLLLLTSRPRRGAAPTRVRSFGELVFVSLGAGLVLAGLTISALGVTDVFVPSDLDFLGLSRAQLDGLSPQLIPVIAHDRAGLGGVIACLGVLLVVVSWSGLGPGRSWLWWTLLASGCIAVLSAVGVHVATGYVDVLHLAPAVAGGVGFIVALSLTYPLLHRRAS